MKRTWPNIPGSSSPSGFGRRTSVRSVRDALSSEPGEAGDRPVEHPARELRDEDVDRQALLHRAHVALGDADEHAQGVRLGDVEDLGAGPGVDEGADLGVARRDDAVVGRRDLLEVLQLRQAVDVGLGGDDRRLAGGVVGRLLVDVLLRHGVLRAELLPAVGADPGDLIVGAGLLQGGPGLVQLLVQVRAVDDRHDLAGLHPVADVRGPLGDVARRAGVDRRVLEGLDRRREHGLGGRRALLGDRRR